MLNAFTDAAADSVARAIAGMQREAARENDRREAEHRAAMAELAALQDRIAARLATLKDGERGEAGPQGERGETGEAGPAGPAPSADMIAAEVARYLEQNPPQPGRDGERGPAGEPGRLPVVRAWADGVHYAADVVTHRGASWQANRDTGREPPHEDWTCIAAAGLDGHDGRSITVRGTWTEGEDYRALDLVVLGGSSFLARCDAPGACPGDGWQVVATRGKAGKPGDQGPPGARGERGPAGPAVISHEIDDEGMLTTRNADGTATRLDLYPILSKIGGR